MSPSPPGRAKFFQKNKKKILKTDTIFFALLRCLPTNFIPPPPSSSPQIIAAGWRKSLKTLPHNFLLITRTNFLNGFGALKYIREKHEEEKTTAAKVGCPEATIPSSKHQLPQIDANTVDVPHFALPRALRNVPMVITGDA